LAVAEPRGFRFSKRIGPTDWRLGGVGGARHTEGAQKPGGTAPLALTAGFQRASLIGTGLVLAAALIAFMATNTRAGQHTARREPVLNAVPEEA
jgi:hypothetical protein